MQPTNLGSNASATEKETEANGNKMESKGPQALADVLTITLPGQR